MATSIYMRLSHRLIAHRASPGLSKVEFFRSHVLADDLSDEQPPSDDETENNNEPATGSDLSNVDSGSEHESGPKDDLSTSSEDDEDETTVPKPMVNAETLHRLKVRFEERDDCFVLLDPLSDEQSDALFTAMTSTLKPEELRTITLDALFVTYEDRRLNTA